MSGRNAIYVVSPQFPCGAAWLANALIELNVRPVHLWGFDTAGEWLNEPDGTSTYAATDLPWRQTLASLYPGRRFRFRSDISPRFSHEFPWQFDAASSIVYVVRDPRDALYSEWQRHRRNLALSPSIDLPQFVLQPFFDGPISIIDMLWLHLRAWLLFADAHPQRTCLLRFEDWKQSPVDSLRTVTGWMGVSATDGELARVAASSDVRHLQRIETALEATEPASRQFNRRGVAEEWRETWRPEWFGMFGPHWRPVFERLRYPVPPLSNVTLPMPDQLSTILAWRELTDEDLLRQWRESILDRSRALRKS